MGSVALTIVAFNLLLIIVMAVIYFRKGVQDDRLNDLEEFCAGIPHSARIPDPYVLRDGRWISRKDPDYPHPV